MAVVGQYRLPLWRRGASHTDIAKRKWNPPPMWFAGSFRAGAIVGIVLRTDQRRD